MACVRVICAVDLAPLLRRRGFFIVVHYHRVNWPQDFQQGRDVLFINGVMVKKGIRSAVEEVYLGNQMFCGAYGAYAGEADEFRIWRTARTVSELRANMNCGPGTPQADLLLYYSANTATSVLLQDLSGNNRSYILDAANNHAALMRENTAVKNFF